MRKIIDSGWNLHFLKPRVLSLLAVQGLHAVQRCKKDGIRSVGPLGLKNAGNPWQFSI